MLKGDSTDWLLGEENPSVRYFALKDLLSKSERNSDVVEARQRIMEIGIVPEILAKQKPGGYWGNPEDFYIRSKYRGTVWQLIILAELGADGKDERAARTCEFILRNSQDRQSEGFAYIGTEKNGGQHSGVIPCLTGNMVWSLIRLGYLADARVQKGIEWIAKYQRFDDKIKEAPRGWPYEEKPRCWGRHCCHMGVVKALKALAEIPADRRSAEVNDTLKKGVEYLLKHHIFKRSHDLNRVSKPSWLQFGFPLMWQTDALEILGILTKLGCRDERMQETVDLVVSKQDEKGRWLLESTFNGRFLVNIEHKGKQSKWVTLNALRALKTYYS